MFAEHLALIAIRKSDKTGQGTSLSFEDFKPFYTKLKSKFQLQLRFHVLSGFLLQGDVKMSHLLPNLVAMGIQTPEQLRDAASSQLVQHVDGINDEVAADELKQKAHVYIQQLH